MSPWSNKLSVASFWDSLRRLNKFNFTKFIGLIQFGRIGKNLIQIKYQLPNDYQLRRKKFTIKSSFHHISNFMIKLKRNARRVQRKREDCRRKLIKALNLLDYFDDFFIL